MSAVEATPFGLIPGDTSSSSSGSSAEDRPSSRSRTKSTKTRCLTTGKRGLPARTPASTPAAEETPRLRQSQDRRHSVRRGDDSRPLSAEGTLSGFSTTDLNPATEKETSRPSSPAGLAIVNKRETPPAKIVPPPPVPSSLSSSTANTILIFDWDDTLCPSTWLGINNLTLDENCLVCPQKATILAQMADCSRRLLEVATKLGSVVIVTNAEEGWINLSCKKFLPSLYCYLSKFKQLSARTRYEKQVSNCPFTWKQMAFRDEIYAHLVRTQSKDNCGEDNSVCVVSLGDSAHERLALISLTKMVTFRSPYEEVRNSANLMIAGPPTVPRWGKCRTKSIKFIERPGIDELMQEHSLIINMLEGVVNHTDDMDLYIRSSSGTAPAPPTSQAPGKPS